MNLLHLIRMLLDDLFLKILLFCHTHSLPCWRHQHDLPTFRVPVIHSWCVAAAVADNV